MNTMKARRKITAKNWGPAPTRARKLDERIRKQTEFDERNLVEAERAPRSLLGFRKS